MADDLAASPGPTCEPDLDENVVDLAQIRTMLDLEPAERLARVTEFMNSLLAETQRRP